MASPSPNLSAQSSTPRKFSDESFSSKQNSSTTSPRNAVRYRALWIESAARVIRLLDSNYQISGDGLSSELAAVLQKRIQAEVGLTGNNAATLTDLEVSKSSIGKKGVIHQILSEFVAAKTGIDVQKTKKLIAGQFISLLNHAEWKPVAHEHATILAEGIEKTYRSEIVPLNSYFADRFALAGSFEKYSRNGLSSGALKIEPLASTKSSPAISNGWLTTLRTSEGEPLFQGFRSATLVHYGISDPKIRADTTEKAAQELLLAAVAVNISERALRASSRLPLKIATFELQTRVESTKLQHPLATEAPIVDQAFYAMKQLEKQESVAIFRGENFPALEIPVDVKVVGFNFPVHEKSFREKLGYKEEVAARNAESLDVLMADAKAALQDTSIGEKNKAKIKLLMKELEEIFAGAAWEITQDPYRFNSRLINLAYLVGYTVHFNCRSGKDRTGIVDAEVKYVAEALDVAVETATPGIAPQFTRVLNENEQTTLAAFALYGGNAEIQAHNSGVPGSKLKPIGEVLEQDALVNRIGVARWEQFKGLSYVAST